MDVPTIIYPAGDPVLIDTIVGQLKSQGTFDQFRKECVADVDTKPAYQNLHQRVETAVAKFLEGQKWRPDMNKNQLRDSLRKHIHELGFLETGVERIVDQVVNPKVHTVFMPPVEDVVYRVQGIPKPEKKPQSSTAAASLGSGSKNGGLFNSTLFSQPPPFLPGLSFLPPALQTHMQKPPPTLADLLPTDLDPVSPESSKGSLEEKERLKVSEITREHDESLDSHLSGFSDLTSHGSEHEINSKAVSKDASVRQVADEDSHLSKVSSNSRLSFTSSDEKSQETKERNTMETDDLEENQQSVNRTVDKMSKTLLEHDNHTSPKTPPHKPEEDSVIHYEDQFSKEEEVATTVTDHVSEKHTVASVISEDSLDFAPHKDVKIDNVIEKSTVDEDRSCSAKEEEVHSDSYRDHESIDLKKEPNTHFRLVEVDETSVHQSEESQCSEGSENKLQIDEMKDSNSQSEQSVQNFDQGFTKVPSYEVFGSKDSSCGKSPSENIVEASEEARHGFDDSQDELERPPPPPLPSPPVVSTPPAPPSYSQSPKSNGSFRGEEDGIPRTPRWEPLSPGCVGNNAPPSLEGPSTSYQKEENYPESSKNNLELEEISQSGSEDMQLAWSPLSVNENKDEDDSTSKNAFEGTECHNFYGSEETELPSSSAVSSNHQEKESKEHDKTLDLKSYLQSMRDKQHEDHQDKNKIKERSRDDRDRERSKDEDRSHKDSTSSSKRHDEKPSSRHKDSRDRRDSSSRSRHENRSRSSSHHKSEDKRKGDRERSSSKHKSSRSEERHRHKERDSKTHVGSRCEEKDRDKSSKELKSSSKSHSSDRDRRDRDKRDKEAKDKEKRVDKERDRRESKHSDKRRDKEKDKEKKEKFSNACRPNNERRSPDLDSNNGSMFGGSQTTNATVSSTNQLKDGSKDDSNKDGSPINSDSKSSDSNQNKDVCTELSSTSHAASASPPSSLPFKKRPLHPDSSEIDESHGRLILRIKKVKLEPPYHDQEVKKTFKSERVLQSKHNMDSEGDQNSLSKVEDHEASLSPLLYFESDWPTKSDDEAFISFVKQLDQSKDLSELPDIAETEQEVNLHHIGSRIAVKSKGLSVSVLTENQVDDFLASQSFEKDVKSNQKKGKMRQRKRSLNTQMKNRSRSRQSHTSNERKELKHKKEAVKEPHQDSLVLFKSQRERKPNKRYSNEEFTSNFGYEDDELAEENYLEDHETQGQLECDINNRLTGIGNSSSMHNESENSEQDALNSLGSRSNAISTTENTSIVRAAPKAQDNESQRRGSSHSWNRDEEDSNSEDENDTTGYENELIGTALKNLMMESGLGGPEEASGLDKLSSTSQLRQNPTGCANKRVQPLSGVKRVGLSRNYKTKTKVNVQTTNQNVSTKSSTNNEEFPFPLHPENDVSASSLVKRRMTKAKKAVLGVVVSDADYNGDIEGHSAKKSERVKQHYNSDDLYKPRPHIRFTSKRRQVVAEENSLW